ncbi:1064_t:CDS:2 [Ambispora gerdemannii]|uniref:1064_t:CDS:1 n=1 Tax=Ambispora gerdemannii TaxID=144530 RepID=A0A9N8V5S9_9GLOM|nr:1064_t:CDS:2 [Ambispora gerdemannii]
MTSQQKVTEDAHVLGDFSVTPIGVGTSTSNYIAETQKVLKESGLNYKLHASGTNIEGRWDDVLSTIRKCVDRLYEMGVSRVDINIRINASTRTDKKLTLEDSIRITEMSM